LSKKEHFLKVDKLIMSTIEQRRDRINTHLTNKPRERALF